MKKNILLLTSSLATFLFPVKANEYIYPVASMHHEGRFLVCLLYQKEGGVGLLSWDPITKQVGKVLSSRFVPTDIQALPDQSGFSFIDQGVIWVKSFSKRSPRPLDISSPLSNIDEIFWKNSQSCYFSAYQKERYSLFELDLQGNLDCLVSSQEADCIYPQKVTGSLFFLSRNRTNGTYKLCQTAYPSIYHEPFTFNSDLNFDERVEQLFHDFQYFPPSLRSISECSSLYTFENSVSFLNMISDSEGFVLGHHTPISSDCTQYQYYHLKKQESAWRCRLLFSFSIPFCLVKPSHIKEHKNVWLYESILPFLPLYLPETRQLYYSHCSENCLSLYCYDLESGNTIQITQSANEFCFSPHYAEGKLYCGGVIDTVVNKYESEPNLPNMWLNKDGRVSLSLYQLDPRETFFQ